MTRISAEPALKYIIEAFNKDTELLAFAIELPDNLDERLITIMGWRTSQWGYEGYNLSAQQARAIETLIDRAFFDDRHIFQLTCNVP